MITKIFIAIYWIVLLAHNCKQLNKQGLIPLLSAVNFLVIIGLVLNI